MRIFRWTAGVHAWRSAPPIEPTRALWDCWRGGYHHFTTYTDRRVILVDLIRDEARRLDGPVVALDIGCGTGISDDPAVNGALVGQIKAAVTTLWGVEPDPTARPTHPHFDRIYMSTLETLDLSGQSVQLAYSSLVQEHVEDADTFFAALFTHLAPGGVYLGLTVNGRHAFARITRLLRWLRLDELVLRVLGHSLEYHYPVRYRCNDTNTITRAALRAGFLAPTFVMCESGEARRYFRGPLRPLYAFLEWKRRHWRRPEALLNLIVRVEKPAATAMRPLYVCFAEPAELK